MTLNSHETLCVEFWSVGHVGVCMYVCIYVCVYVCMYVCMHASMLVCVCVYACIFIRAAFRYTRVLVRRHHTIKKKGISVYEMPPQSTHPHEKNVYTHHVTHTQLMQLTCPYEHQIHSARLRLRPIRRMFPCQK